MLKGLFISISPHVQQLLHRFYAQKELLPQLDHYLVPVGLALPRYAGIPLVEIIPNLWLRLSRLARRTRVEAAVLMGGTRKSPD